MDTILTTLMGDAKPIAIVAGILGAILMAWPWIRKELRSISDADAIRAAGDALRKEMGELLDKEQAKVVTLTASLDEASTQMRGLREENGGLKADMASLRKEVRAMPKVVNLGRPRILMVEIPRAEYRPVMQAPFEDAVSQAQRGVADLMAGELAENLRHRGGGQGAGDRFHGPFAAHASRSRGLARATPCRRRSTASAMRNVAARVDHEREAFCSIWNPGAVMPRAVRCARGRRGCDPAPVDRGRGRGAPLSPMETCGEALACCISRLVKFFQTTPHSTFGSG